MDIKKTWLFTRPIAHRGLHNYEFPENSLGAFENAAANGYPIELDVRLTADGIVVVFHDDTLSRMTHKDGYVGTINASELQDIRLLLPDENETIPSQYGVPTFQEVLELVNGRVPILIETKSPKGQSACGPLESKVIDILRGYRGEYAVQAFNPYSMEYFKLHAFEIRRGQLSANFTKDDLKGAIKRSILRKLRMNRVSQPDFISYQAEALPNKYVLKTGLPCLAWTVRSNAEYEKVKPHCGNIIFENFIPDAAEEEKE